MSTWLDKQDPVKVESVLTLYRERQPRVSQYAHGDERFGVWLYLVDRVLTGMIGVGLFDLADWNIRDAYDDGLSPGEAAREAMRNDDTYSDYLPDEG